MECCTPSCELPVSHRAVPVELAEEAVAHLRPHAELVPALGVPVLTAGLAKGREGKRARRKAKAQGEGRRRRHKAEGTRRRQGGGSSAQVDGHTHRHA